MDRSATARSPWPLAFLLPLALIWGCGGSDSPSDPIGNGPQDPSPGNGAPVNTTSVTVRDNLFEPPAIAVSPGATVTWTWSGGEPHNVTWATGGLTNSTTQTTGTYTATMPSATGDLVYYCTLHGTPSSGMRGTVRIQ